MNAHPVRLRPTLRRLQTSSIAVAIIVFLILLGACSPVAPPDSEQVMPEETSSDSVATGPEDVGPEDVAVDAPALPVLPSAIPEETYRGLPVGFTEDGRAFRGDPNAPLIMIEYSDFQCPFCNRYFVQTEPAIDEAYVRSGEVLVIFHDFPLAQLHPPAPLAHNVGLCVADQGSAETYWQLRSEIFRSADEWGNSSEPLLVLTRLVEEVGGDAEAMLDCIQEDRFGPEVDARVNAALAQGFSGTPSFQIVRPADGEVFQIVGAQPYDQFAGLIDALLAGQTPREAQAGEPQAADDGPPLWATSEGLVPDPARPGYTVAGDLYRGNPDASVVVVEFSDFQCPFCRRHVLETQPTLDELYVDTDQVMWVFKHFPLSIHPQAPAAGAAAECAADQGQFWEMHHLLFETTSEWAVAQPEPVLIDVASRLDGLDMAEFEACMAGGDTLARVESDMIDGAPYVRGTPTFIILYNEQGSIVPGALPLETFVEVMDEILAEAQ